MRHRLLQIFLVVFLVELRGNKMSRGSQVINHEKLMGDLDRDKKTMLSQISPLVDSSLNTLVNDFPAKVDASIADLEKLRQFRESQKKPGLSVDNFSAKVDASIDDYNYLQSLTWNNKMGLLIKFKTEVINGN